jgi:hypothetical protein
MCEVEIEYATDVKPFVANLLPPRWLGVGTGRSAVPHLFAVMRRERGLVYLPGSFFFCFSLVGSTTRGICHSLGKHSGGFWMAK